MSYCRWSTDDFKCDLYIYEDVAGGWTIMDRLGADHNLPTPGECADKVRELAAAGRCVPDYVAKELDEEQADLDANGPREDYAAFWGSVLANSASKRALLAELRIPYSTATKESEA